MKDGPEMEIPDYELLFRNTPDKQIIMDRDLKVIAMSNDYAKVTHRKHIDMIGYRLNELFPQTEPSEKMSKIIDSILEVIKTGKPVHLPTFRYDIYGDDGKIMVPKFW